MTTLVNLPPTAYGQTAQFRWRTGYDGCFTPANAGMRIDTISIFGSSRICNTACDIVRLVVTSTLARDNATTVRATYTVQNIGRVTANNVMLTTAMLGSANTTTTLPQLLGNLGPGQTSAPMAVLFTNSTPGASSTLKLGGTYDGGTFSSTKRVTIP